jgi:hypothetical protein
MSSPINLKMRDEAVIFGRTSLFSKDMCPINQKGMTSEPLWFLSPGVGTCVTWRGILANRDKCILVLKFMGTRLLNNGYNLYRDIYCNIFELGEMLLGAGKKKERKKEKKSKYLIF